jgi:glycosyltransferase involved in cell wall biosynthesis
VVATRHAGIPDVVVHGRTGFLVDEHDVDGMASYLLELVSNRELCQSMGAEARERIRRHFSIESHISRLQRVIDDARTQRPTRSRAAATL